MGRMSARPLGRSSRRAAVVITAAVAVVAFAAAARAGGGPGTAPAPRVDDIVMRNTALTAIPSSRALSSATWCGTPSAIDAKPNAVAGYPVHFIYAVPSDGTVRLSTFANRMETDWEAIDSWWRGQDPTRTPRADVAQFACGLQLDLSSVKLRQSGAQLAAQEEPFDQIFDSLDSEGFTSQFTKYVVYYDGPVGDDGICGIGGTLRGGLGLAVVSVRACEGVDTAQIAAHELTHTLGAVPPQAPHDCPAPNDGHTCDNDRDLMYPVTDGTPLSGLILDPGRDDYYGHSGAWLDVQDSPWLVQLDRQSPLSLAVSGSGQVEADVPGLLCSRSCSTNWNAGTQLSLSATPGQNAKFIRWGGACTGSSRCLVAVGQGGVVSALFAPLTYRLIVRVSGKGAIRSANAGIACPGRCTAPVSSYRQLRLNAAPAKGWKLRGWTGACAGKRAVCTLPMTGNASARAIFAKA
jgi:Divergent InlB B-repeat domain